MAVEHRPPIIVTGDTGFIGRAVVKRLSADYPIVGFNRRGQAADRPGASAEPVDLTDAGSIRAGVDAVRQRHGDRVASVIHLAAYYDFATQESPRYEEITVRGTERLLEALRPMEVEQFVFSSTMLVHEPADLGDAIDESDPLAPTWGYPASKLRTERLIRERRGGMPVVLLRISGVYDDECNSIPIANQIQRVAERRMTSRVYPGDTELGQAFMHLDDLVDAIQRVVERRRRLPEEATILLGEPELLSYGELQDLLGRLIHGDEQWTTIEIPKLVAKAGALAQDWAPVEDPFIKAWMVDRADDHYPLDIDRARRMLGWSPRRRLRDALPRMIDALKRDPEAFYRRNDLGSPPAGLRRELVHAG